MAHPLFDRILSMASTIFTFGVIGMGSLALVESAKTPSGPSHTAQLLLGKSAMNGTEMEKEGGKKKKKKEDVKGSNYTHIWNV